MVLELIPTQTVEHEEHGLAGFARLFGHPRRQVRTPVARSEERRNDAADVRAQVVRDHRCRRSDFVHGGTVHHLGWVEAK